MNALDKVARIVARNNSLLCIGLDSEWERLPPHLYVAADPQFEFNRALIDATHELAATYKLQSACYEARGIPGLQSLKRTLEYLRDVYPHHLTILDAKRADIPDTNTMYARAVFEYWQADATTVVPYTGLDALEPFARYADRLTFVVVRSSNPGARDLQDVDVRGTPLFVTLAQKLAALPYPNLGAVAGATYPDDLRKVRASLPDRWLLVPGVGAQGGAVATAVRAGVDSEGSRLLINASRSIIFASNGTNFADQARALAQLLRDEINLARESVQA